MEEMEPIAQVVGLATQIGKLDMVDIGKHLQDGMVVEEAEE